MPVTRWRWSVSSGPSRSHLRVLKHAFDPFYTTRLEKGGTGLGLSTVHGVVTGHGGTIGVASEAGRGAVFTIEFPRHAAAPAGQDPAGGGVDTSGGHGLESPPVGPPAAREPGAADRAR
ncbi:MAG: hypothetical protein KA354_03990 [Phycisphaerae bacterium]|nr:hypothetical protein [Phycisphaerae bacterium]